MGFILESKDIVPVLLAPMAGVTDEVFRQLCIEQGAQGTYTEMVSSKALQYESRRTFDMLVLAENENNVAVQLFGHEPAIMAREACQIEEILGERLSYLDINMGCPARKIAGKGDGAALMLDPPLAAAIVREVARAVSCPVTVKFRRGFEMGCETAPEFAVEMQKAGARAVAVHGRFAKQMYAGSSDRTCIARVVKAVDIPVVGNGDIFEADDALSMLEQTGCSALMIGRGAQGNPWLFAQVRASLEGKDAPSAPTVAQRIDMMRRHAELLSQRGSFALKRMRKHAMWYVHGLPGASFARGRFSTCDTLDDFNDVFDALEEACLLSEDSHAS